MTDYRVGIYIRLSLADEDTGAGKPRATALATSGN